MIGPVLERSAKIRRKVYWSLAWLYEREWGNSRVCGSRCIPFVSDT
jgi:hypothetical protein